MDRCTYCSIGSTVAYPGLDSSSGQILKMSLSEKLPQDIKTIGNNGSLLKIPSQINMNFQANPNCYMAASC